ncbi:MAG: class I SAM-dependent methyltransferase [Alphaproteobacteria bacterium]
MALIAGASPSVARRAAAYRYLYYSDRIDGWMYQTTALALMELIWFQEEAGLTGNIAEIGVRHGCSALALVAAARPDEAVVAIDLFDRQDLNVDDSGGGNLAAFQGHLQYLFPHAQVRIIATSSTEIRGAEQEHGLNGLRFFSVDGGHTVALTLNDLEIADTSLAPHGIAALDDVLNADWTGVASGLFAFLARGANLVPFAIFPNKILLCRRAFVQFYRNHCRDSFAYALDKQDLEFQSYSVDVYADRWPVLAGRLADPEVAAAAQADLRAIDASGPPVRRHLIARPGDGDHASSQLEHMQSLLAREERRAEVLQNKIEQARLETRTAANQVAALRSSTSWRITAPLRWFGSALSRGLRR